MKKSAAVFREERNTNRKGWALNHFLAEIACAAVSAATKMNKPKPHPFHSLRENLGDRKPIKTVSPTQAKGIDRAISATTKSLFLGKTSIGDGFTCSTVKPKNENILKVTTIGTARRNTNRLPTATTFVRNRLKSAIP